MSVEGAGRRLMLSVDFSSRRWPWLSSQAGHDCRGATIGYLHYVEFGRYRRGHIARHAAFIDDDFSIEGAERCDVLSFRNCRCFDARFAIVDFSAAERLTTPPGGRISDRYVSSVCRRLPRRAISVTAPAARRAPPPLAFRRSRYAPSFRHISRVSNEPG